jgi:hypothetical protein
LGAIQSICAFEPAVVGLTGSLIEHEQLTTHKFGQSSYPDGSRMSTIIEEILGKMGKFPLARVEHDASSITYFPNTSNGFVVRLVVLGKGSNNEGYSVYYNGSHEEFSERESAILAFGFGLSTDRRVREFTRGGKPYRWVVDVWHCGRWRPAWEEFRLCAVLWQFWRTSMVRRLQNRLIDLSTGPDPDAMAGVLVPVPPGGGLPSLSAAKEIPREEKSPDDLIGGYEPPPAPCS